MNNLNLWWLHHATNATKEKFVVFLSLIKLRYFFSEKDETYTAYIVATPIGN